MPRRSLRLELKKRELWLKWQKWSIQQSWLKRKQRMMTQQLTCSPQPDRMPPKIRRDSVKIQSEESTPFPVEVHKQNFEKTSARKKMKFNDCQTNTALQKVVSPSSRRNLRAPEFTLVQTTNKKSSLQNDFVSPVEILIHKKLTRVPKMPSPSSCTVSSLQSKKQCLGSADINRKQVAEKVALESVSQILTSPRCVPHTDNHSAFLHVSDSTISVELDCTSRVEPEHKISEPESTRSVEPECTRFVEPESALSVELEHTSCVEPEHKISEPESTRSVEPECTRYVKQRTSTEPADAAHSPGDKSVNHETDAIRNLKPIVLVQKLPEYCQTGSPVSVASLSRMNSPSGSLQTADHPLTERSCDIISSAADVQPSDIDTIFSCSEMPNKCLEHPDWISGTDSIDSAYGNSAVDSPGAGLVLTSLELAANGGIDDEGFESLLGACAKMTKVNPNSERSSLEDHTNEHLCFSATADESFYSVCVNDLDKDGTQTAVQTLMSHDQMCLPDLSHSCEPSQQIFCESVGLTAFLQPPPAAAECDIMNRSINRKRCPPKEIESMNKRKRGHPPKDCDNMNKEKRGRPPKDCDSMNKGKKGHPPQNCNSMNKKRGCPPKDIDNMNKGERGHPKDKAKRGCPPKDSDSMNKGKRGHPPKDSDSMNKGKRGHPPKDSDSMNKGKRGRPLKDIESEKLIKGKRRWSRKGQIKSSLPDAGDHSKEPSCYKVPTIRTSEGVKMLSMSRENKRKYAYYRCGHCSFRTKEKTCKEKHIKICHPHMCHSCRQRFSLLEAFDVHRKACAMESYSMCSVCEKKFHKSHRKQHFHSHLHRLMIRSVRNAARETRLYGNVDRILSCITCDAKSECKTCHPTSLSLGEKEKRVLKSAVLQDDVSRTSALHVGKVGSSGSVSSHGNSTNCIPVNIGVSSCEMLPIFDGMFLTESTVEDKSNLACSKLIATCDNTRNTTCVDLLHLLDECDLSSADMGENSICDLDKMFSDSGGDAKILQNSGDLLTCRVQRDSCVTDSLDENEIGADWGCAKANTHLDSDRKGNDLGLCKVVTADNLAAYGGEDAWNVGEVGMNWSDIRAPEACLAACIRSSSVTNIGATETCLATCVGHGSVTDSGLNACRGCSGLTNICLVTSEGFGKVTNTNLITSEGFGKVTNTIVATCEGHSKTTDGSVVTEGGIQFKKSGKTLGTSDESDVISFSCVEAERNAGTETSVPQDKDRVETTTISVGLSVTCDPHLSVNPNPDVVTRNESSAFHVSLSPFGRNCYMTNSADYDMTGESAGSLKMKLQTGALSTCPSKLVCTTSETSPVSMVDVTVPGVVCRWSLVNPLTVITKGSSTNLSVFENLAVVDVADVGTAKDGQTVEDTAVNKNTKVAMDGPSHKAVAAQDIVTVDMSPNRTTVSATSGGSLTVMALPTDTQSAINSMSTVVVPSDQIGVQNAPTVTQVAASGTTTVQQSVVHTAVSQVALVTQSISGIRLPAVRVAPIGMATPVEHSARSRLDGSRSVHNCVVAQTTQPVHKSCVSLQSVDQLSSSGQMHGQIAGNGSYVPHTALTSAVGLAALKPATELAVPSASSASARKPGEHTVLTQTTPIFESSVKLPGTVCEINGNTPPVVNAYRKQNSVNRTACYRTVMHPATAATLTTKLTPVHTLPVQQTSEIMPKVKETGVNLVQTSTVMSHPKTTHAAERPGVNQQNGARVVKGKQDCSRVAHLTLDVGNLPGLKRSTENTYAALKQAATSSYAIDCKTAVDKSVIQTVCSPSVLKPTTVKSPTLKQNMSRVQLQPALRASTTVMQAHVNVSTVNQADTVKKADKSRPANGQAVNGSEIKQVSEATTGTQQANTSTDRQTVNKSTDMIASSSSSVQQTVNKSLNKELGNLLLDMAVTSVKQTEVSTPRQAGNTPVDAQRLSSKQVAGSMSAVIAKQVSTPKQASVDRTTDHTVPSCMPLPVKPLVKEKVTMNMSAVKQTLMNASASVQTMHMVNPSVKQTDVNASTSVQTVHMVNPSIKQTEVNASTSVQAVHMVNPSVKQTKVNASTSLQTVHMVNPSVKQTEVNASTSLQTVHMVNPSVKQTDVNVTTSVQTMHTVNPSVRQTDVNASTSLQTVHMVNLSVKQTAVNASTSVQAVYMVNPSVKQTAVSTPTAMSTSAPKQSVVKASAVKQASKCSKSALNRGAGMEQVIGKSGTKSGSPKSAVSVQVKVKSPVKVPTEQHAILDDEKRMYMPCISLTAAAAEKKNTAVQKINIGNERYGCKQNITTDSMTFTVQISGGHEALSQSPLTNKIEENPVKDISAVALRSCNKTCDRDDIGCLQVSSNAPETASEPKYPDVSLASGNAWDSKTAPSGLSPQNSAELLFNHQNTKKRSSLHPDTKVESTNLPAAKITSEKFKNSEAPEKRSSLNNNNSLSRKIGFSTVRKHSTSNNSERACMQSHVVSTTSPVVRDTSVTARCSSFNRSRECKQDAHTTSNSRSKHFKRQSKTAGQSSVSKKQRILNKTFIDQFTVVPLVGSEHQVEQITLGPPYNTSKQDITTSVKSCVGSVSAPRQTTSFAVVGNKGNSSTSFLSSLHTGSAKGKPVFPCITADVKNVPGKERFEASANDTTCRDLIHSNGVVTPNNLRLGEGGDTMAMVFFSDACVPVQPAGVEVGNSAVMYEVLPCQLQYPQPLFSSSMSFYNTSVQTPNLNGVSISNMMFPVLPLGDGENQAALLTQQNTNQLPGAHQISTTVTSGPYTSVQTRGLNGSSISAAQFILPAGNQNEFLSASGPNATVVTSALTTFILPEYVYP